MQIKMKKPRLHQASKTHFGLLNLRLDMHICRDYRDLNLPTLIWITLQKCLAGRENLNVEVYWNMCKAWHSAFTEFKLAFKIFEVGKYQIILETFVPNFCLIMLKSSSKLSISTVSRLDYVFITNKLNLCFCSTVWKSLNFSLVNLNKKFVKSRLLCI